MTDSETTREAVPTTAFLPDYLFGGGAGIPRVRTVDEVDDTDGDPTAEFRRSWRRHRSESRSFPF